MIPCTPCRLDFAVEWFYQYKFSHPFEPPIKACTSFYVGVLAQKATRLGRFLDPGW
jgi:hypothetical protein